MAFSIINTITRFPYAIIAALLFIAEVCIALWITEPFIRGFLGDTLVIVLLFTIIKSLFNRPQRFLAEAILVFAIVVEFSQYLKIIDYLNIESQFIKVIMGQVFDWFDILAYVIGYAICKGIRNL